MFNKMNVEINQIELSVALMVNTSKHLMGRGEHFLE